MSDEPITGEGPMTREELDSFTRKLEAFTEDLTPKERALLLQVLMRAGSEDVEDVEAHALGQVSLGAAALALQARGSKPSQHMSTIGAHRGNAGIGTRTTPNRE